MPPEIYVLVGTVVGAVISAVVGVVVALINNRNQRNLTEQRQLHERALENDRLKHEIRKREVEYFRGHLEAAHERLSRISIEHSQTASYIHSSGMAIDDYHNRYLENCQIMDKVRVSSDLCFSEIRPHVDKVFRSMNLFWGSQQGMMYCESQENREGVRLALGEILEASNCISENVQAAKGEMRDIARELNKCMQPTPRSGAADA